MNTQSSGLVGREYLIKRPLAYKIHEDLVVDAGIKRARDMVLKEFASKTTTDCQKCPSAVMRDDQDFLSQTWRFSLTCSQKVCQRAGWTRSGPIPKSQLDVEKEVLDDIRAIAKSALGAMPLAMSEQTTTSIIADQEFTDDELRDLLGDAPVSTDIPKTAGFGSW